MAPMSAGFNNILQTGGAPNIQAALDAIKNQGMTNLQGTLGDITEQYSALGLGKGSDILGALGTGASKGIADIIAQQSQLSAQVNNAASDRMVSAGSVYGGMYNSMQDRRVSAASPMLGYGNMLTGAQDAAWGRAAAMAPTAASMAEAPAKYASMDADRAMQGAGIMSGIGSSYGGLMMQGADIGSRNLLQAAGLDMTLNENNMTRNYNDFLRMQGPSPWFDQAMQLATSYPNVNKPVVPSNNNTAAIVGALGQIGAASIPYIAAAASDRRL
jgi:hypothetical protein